MMSQKIVPAVYNIDPMHSKAGFEISHLVISTVEGKFKNFSGKLDIKEDFLKSVIEASLGTKSIDTGVDQRDDHLRSADFFNVSEFPEIRFKSTRIEGNPESFKLIGDLTIRDVTKEVILESKYFGNVVDGYGNNKAVFEGKTVINRKDFGLTWSSLVEVGPVVGDKVKIELKIQAAEAK